MSFAATSRSAARGRRALILSAVALVAAVAALFGGVGSASGASAALCLTTTSAPTATPSSVPAGSPITYTATVTAAAGCTNGSPTGTVAFYSNYSVNGQPQSFQIGFPVQLQPTGTSGQSIATLVDNSLPRGSFEITAVYTSTDQSVFWNSASSVGTPVAIGSNTPTTTTMDFTENPSTITVGQNVTFNVHITPVDQSGNPTGAVATGTVHFSAGPTAASGQVHFASVQLDGTGSVTFSYAGFVPGDYIVLASYTGDPQDYGISGELPLTVLAAATPVATSTTIVATPSSISTGDSTTLNAHVVEPATQTPPPVGGTVNFFAGPNPTNVTFEGTGTLDAQGNAQLTVGNFTTGAYTVRAQYLGSGNDVAGSSGDGALLVSATATGGGNELTSQIAYTGSVEAVFGTQATLSGHLEKGDGSPLSGKPLTLAMGAQTCTTGVTDGSGNASCVITVSQASGQYQATAQFAGDGDWAPAIGSSAFVVDEAPTQLAYTGATSGAGGSPATLSAHLTTNGSSLGGQLVTLTLDTLSCTGTTDSSGVASCTVTPTEAPGTYAVAAHFTDGAEYLPSDASATFTVTSSSTTTAYTGATQGAHGATATLSAHVTGAPDGGTVTFTLGTQQCSGTLSSGNASCTVTLVDAPGTGYTVQASYAGDASHQPSSDSKSFTIVAATSTTQAGPVAPVLAGTSATLKATVVPAAATGTVTFSSGATTLCTAPLSNGNASCAATFAQTGSYAVTARYGGDGVYPASSGTTTVLVYAFAPGGGSFVVGDKSASGSVTFWGAQWAKINVLSGGGAPDAFKGFALDGATCGATWSTDPGNSSPPPAGALPAYMAVIVTSASSKAGSTIYGNTVAIVIVQTNAGYKNDPGHAGTGTVVATLCTGSAALTKPATKTTYTGATSGTTGSAATLSATLTDAGGTPLNGETVTLTAGTQSCTDKTDPKGNASCAVTLTQGAGTYPVTATFAGDAGYAGSNASATFTIGTASLDCKKSKCESLLADPSVNGRTLSLAYMDDSPIKSATAVANGQSLPVAITATSGQPANYVDANGGSKSTKNQSLLTIALPAAGTYTVVVTAYDGDGDLDQYVWTVTVP